MGTLRRPPQHRLRAPLAEELHARPFAPLTAPAELLNLAFAPEDDAARRDPSADLAHLNALLQSLGAKTVHPPAGGPLPSHHAVEAAGLRITWERHTEFVSVTLTSFATPERPFEPWLVERLAQDWLDAAPGPVISAALLHVEAAPDAGAAEAAMKRLSRCFDLSSIAQATVTEGEAIAMGDFRLDAEGYVRFGLIGVGDVGPRRLGRIAQRLIELETYRTMALLALPEARRIGPRLNAAEAALTEIVGAIAGASANGASTPDERATLDQLTEIAAELESLKAETAFRFDAGRAYAAIVWERLEAIREERIGSRQLFTEFMVRRFKPSMRSCEAAAARLDGLSDRVSRAANLLRTRVDVSLEAQNQKLLESMNRRAQLQLRLQETVEGFSVVAISYYALNLLASALAPAGAALDLSEKILKALLVAPTVVLVWLFLRQVKRRLDR